MKRIKQLVLIILSLFIILQIALMIFYWGTPQGSDQGAYISTAQQLFEQSEWYPSNTLIQESAWFWAPGLINFLILQLHLFGTVDFNVVFNFLMNIGIVVFLYKLAKKFFSERIAYLAVILYCLLYSNYFVILSAGTEIPFLFLMLSAFSLLVFYPNRFVVSIIAGVTLALSNWVRPLVIVILPIIIGYFVLNKYSLKNYLGLFVGGALMILTIGTITYSKTSLFLFQAKTSGINLAMTANDKAYGGVATSLVSDSTSSLFIHDIEKYNCIQRDSIWKASGVEWVKKNPMQYGFLFLKKIGGLYVEDSWSDRPILGGDGFVDKFVVAGKVDRMAFIREVFIRILKSLVFYIILIFSGVWLWSCRKRLFTVSFWFSNHTLFLLYIIIGTGATCLFSVSPRYHYPFTFAFAIYAALGLDIFVNSFLKNKKKRGAE